MENEDTPENLSPKIMCICSFCRERSTDDMVLELNFADQAIYYVCNNCKKTNTIDIKIAKAAPYPRTRLT